MTMTTTLYLWCPKCKTTAKWRMDATGVYFEQEVYPCACGARDGMEGWDTIRNLISGLPETPGKGVRYDFQCQMAKMPGNPESIAEWGSLEDMAILRLPDVRQLTGLKRSTIYERMTNGSFPRAVSLGTRAIGWRRGDIRAWLQSL